MSLRSKEGRRGEGMKTRRAFKACKTACKTGALGLHTYATRTRASRVAHIVRGRFFSTEIKSEHVARDFVRSKYAKDYRYELLQAANAIIR